MLHLPLKLCHSALDQTNKGHLLSGRTFSLASLRPNIQSELAWLSGIHIFSTETAHSIGQKYLVGSICSGLPMTFNYFRQICTSHSMALKHRRFNQLLATLSTGLQQTTFKYFQQTLRIQSGKSHSVAPVSKYFYRRE